MPESKINRSRAIIHRKFQFKLFLTKRSVPLASAKLQPGEDLLVFERGGARNALIARQMAYHHIAQGEVNGIPYLVSF